MSISGVGGAAFASIPVIGPVGSLLALPLTLTVDEIKRAKTYKFNRAQPMLLPDPGALIDAYLRRIPEGDSPFSAKWLDMSLQYHGLNLGQTIEGFEGHETVLDEPLNCGRHAWRHVMTAMQRVPGIGEVMDALRRNLIRPGVGRRLLRQAGANVDKMLEALPWMYERPGVGEIIDALIRDRIKIDRANDLLREAGANPGLWTDLLDARQTLPGVVELLVARRREFISDRQYTQYLKWHGMRDKTSLDLMRALLREAPGVSDLLRMGSRLLFSPELAGAYGLYDGFQEASRPYFRQLGLDYPLGFQIPVDGQRREATLPDLYWAATREILPLGIAYSAYQRLRENQVQNYTGEVPNLRPFTQDDLRLHMRVAGYPPPMQDYLIALAHPPLGRRDIPQIMTFLGKDADWAYSQYLNLGLRAEDARVVADTQYQRVHAADTAWIVSLQTAARKRTVSEIEGMYDEGILDRNTALRQLSDAGLPDNLSTHLLDLSDARRARGLLRAAVTATGRDYVSGLLSAQEALRALGTYGLQSQRAGELMQIWTIRRSRRRRQADTSRIIKWVGEGRISVDDALSRLTNLGWTSPDILLLVGEGEAKLAALRAKAEATAEKQAAQRAKELERLAREHQAEQKRLIAEANRVASRTTLTKWMLDGVISQDEWRQAMRDRGYPDSAIEDYYRDAYAPRPPRPHVVPAEAARPKPPGSAHPSASLLRRWAKEKIIDRTQFQEGIRSLGFTDEDVNRFVEEEYGGATNEPAPAP